MTTILVDADSCPVKDEVCRVGLRYGLAVRLVANQSLPVPERGDVQAVLVSDRFDAADDWIVEHVRPDDIVITGDILLAARCLEAGARALGPRGRGFDGASIGEALAAREAAATLREMGLDTGGPPAFADRDRSRFLQALDTLVNAVRRGR